MWARQLGKKWELSSSYLTWLIAMTPKVLASPPGPRPSQAIFHLNQNWLPEAHISACPWEARSVPPASVPTSSQWHARLSPSPSQPLASWPHQPCLSAAQILPNDVRITPMLSVAGWIMPLLLQWPHSIPRTWSIWLSVLRETWQGQGSWDGEIFLDYPGILSVITGSF